jgi:hypothetical protein
MKDTDTESIKRELLARIEPVIEDVARELARRMGDGAIYMSMTEYAKHAKVTTKTVSKWVRQGMPANRRGRNIRIRVAEADAWNPIDATRRDAELAAHGAKR